MKRKKERKQTKQKADGRSDVMILLGNMICKINDDDSTNNYSCYIH